MKKRLISMLLAVCMAFTMLPLEAFAAFANEKAPKNAFQDVSTDAWYADAVRYVSENGLFSGTGDNAFSPNGTMSRAMYVTVIGRMVGVDISKYAGTAAFSDVPADAYYAPYVAWAAKLGITSGTKSGQFDPNGVVTREQMAVFTVRLFDALGYKLPAETVSTQPKDFDRVADYAKEAVLRMWRCGMFVGDSAGNFGPKQSALRAEAAAFLMRTDKHLIESGVKEKPKPSDDKDEDDNTTSARYTVTFDTKGGAALSPITVTAGEKLLNQLPTPYKMNAIFAGWYKDAELTQPVTASDTATGNLTLYASYTNADGIAEQETKPFATDLSVSGAWRISITDTTGAMSADEVKSGVAYSCLSNPEYTDMKIESKGEGKYEVYGNGGWPAGSTNKLELLDDKLCFTGKDATIETYNFTVVKEETLDLQLSPTLKELPAGAIKNITQNGAAVYDLSIPLASAKAGLAAAAQSDETGTFTYVPRARSAEQIKVGDTVAIYEGTPPSERTLNGDGEDNYADQSVAYVTIVEVNGDQYKYKGADSQDVLFTPDILPVASNADTDGQPDDKSITVPKATFDFTADKYAGSGLSAETTVDVGDFILFYAAGTDLTQEGSQGNNSNRYALIESVTTVGDNYIIVYKDANQEDVLSAMDLFDDAPISGEQLLGDKTTDEIEDSIEKEATASGFAEEAANYLAALALETDGFKSAAGELNLKRYELTGQDAGELSGSRITTMADSRVKLENLSIKADVRTKLQHLKGPDGEDLSGLRAALTIGFDVVIAAGENKIVVHVEGTFEEEVRLSMNFSGGAVWKWAWIFPYIADYRMNANVDVYNFTGISVNAVVGTFGKDETPDLDAEDDWDNVALQLKGLIEKAEAGEEIIEGIDTMGTSLSDKYSALMDNESDWVELFSVNLTASEGSDVFHILCYGFSADFVVSANMNVSIGFDFYYENGKRYNFTLGLFSKTSQSDTVVLVEEKYEFTFYVMGSIGVRAGLQLEVKVGLFSLQLDSVGITAEAGAYVRMWGYFYYRLTWSATQGRDTQATGALLLEVGIYLDIKFLAQAFNGTFAYNPTIYENEWPLWHAGSRENVQAFSYEQADAPSVEMKKTNYTAVLPDAAFAMSYMDMKDGEMYDKAFDDDKNFTITMTNPAFSYDTKTNTVKVEPGNELQQEGQMIITWKGQPLTFSSKTMSRTIELSWQDIEGAFAITFNSTGGSMVKNILARPGTSIKAPANPTKQGYVFGGWCLDSAGTRPYTVPAVMGSSDVVVYAKWNPATDTKYTVEHYQQKLSNAKQYDLIAADSFSNGVTDSVIQPDVKAYEGFTAPAKQNLTILPDGSAVMQYYYTRNSYTLTFNRGGIDENGDLVYTYKYGAAINAPKVATAGYLFKQWSPDWADNVAHTMPARNLEYTASWTPDPNTPYRVEHYVQNVQGTGYTLNAMTTEKGETESKLILADLALQDTAGITYKNGTVDGAVATETKVNKTGALVIKLYYDRNSYQVNYHVAGGEESSATFRYGAVITQPSEPSKLGYEFTGWFADDALNTPYVFGKFMPAENVDVYGAFVPSTNTKYTVEHYVENVDGSGDTKQKTDTLYGKTGAELTLASLKDATLEVAGGITYSGAKVGDGTSEQLTATILADGSLVIKLYYSRVSHTMTFKQDNGQADIVRTGKYGSTVTVPTVTKTGYDFAGWSPALTAPLTMPAEDVTYTAQWTPKTDTAYTVKYYKQKADIDDEYAVETVIKYGTTGTEATAEQKAYTGFTFNASKSTQSGTIAADGSLVLSMYYDRQSFTVTFNANAEGVKLDGTVQASVTKTFKYGQTIVAPAVDRTGYGLLGWTKDAAGNTSYTLGTMPAESLTLFAKWNAGSAQYKIELYVMNELGEYNTQLGSNDVGHPYYDRTTTGVVGSEVTREQVEALFNSSGNHPYIGKAGFAYDKMVISDSTGTKDSAVITADGSLLIKLHYQRNQYQQTWNGNGGLCDNQETVVKMEYFGAQIRSPRFYKTGYEVSWPELDAITTKYGASMPAKEMVFNATWTPKTIEIIYWDRGNEKFSGTHAEGQPTTFTYGQTFTLKAPTKEGYTFGGWYDNWPCDGTAITTHNGLSDIELVFYAKWLPQSNSILYYAGEGASNPNPDTYETGTTVTLKDPSRSGYTFNGWFTDSERKTPAVKPEIKATDKGVKEFYAQWTAHTYAVTFNANSGTAGSMADLLMTYDTAKNLPANGFTRDGYTFTGWNTQANGSGKSYAAGASVKNLTTAQGGTVTLYAQWGTQSYNITYVPADGTESFPQSYTYETGNITLGTPTRTGYNFIGWYTDSGYTEANKVTGVAIPQGSTGDKTFYAKWTEKTYSIVLMPNEGTVTGGDELTHTYGQELTLPDPTCAGYTFEGWYADSGFTGDRITKIGAQEEWSGTKYFYAKWKLNGVNITYEGLYGTTHNNPESFTHLTPDITLEAPETARTGYTFEGWLYNGAPITTIDTTAMTTDMTITAKWKPIVYKITCTTLYGQYNGTTEYTIESPTITIGAPTINEGLGRLFLGWEVGGSGDPIMNPTIPKGSTGDKIFTEKTVGKTGSIGYYLNGGTNDSQNGEDRAYNKEVVLNEPTRNGYRFYGWYETPDFSGNPIHRIPSSADDGNKTYKLYARWVAEKDIIWISSSQGLKQYEGEAGRGKYLAITSNFTLQTGDQNLTGEFYGVLDGNGKNITGASTDNNSCYLIGENYGVVKNVNFVAGNLTADAFDALNPFGPIMKNYGLVRNCVASTNAIITTYYSNTSTPIVGGLVGWNYREGSIVGSTGAATVGGTATALKAGGIAGQNEGFISKCTAHQTLKLTGLFLGAIAGGNSAGGVIVECTNNTSYSETYSNTAQ